MPCCRMTAFAFFWVSEAEVGDGHRRPWTLVWQLSGCASRAASHRGPHGPSTRPGTLRGIPQGRTVNSCRLWESPSQHPGGEHLGPGTLAVKGRGETASGPICIGSKVPDGRSCGRTGENGAGGEGYFLGPFVSVWGYQMNETCVTTGSGPLHCPSPAVNKFL